MSQSKDEARQRFFGIGTVRPDPREAMIDAAELTARIIRSFAATFGGEQSTFDPCRS